MDRFLAGFCQKQVSLISSFQILHDVKQVFLPLLGLCPFQPEQRDSLCRCFLPLLLHVPYIITAQRGSSLGVSAPQVHLYLYSVSEEPGGCRPAYDTDSPADGSRHAPRSLRRVDDVCLPLLLCRFLLLFVHKYYFNGSHQPRPLLQNR